jgi:hypothetical protein
MKVIVMEMIDLEVVVAVAKVEVVVAKVEMEVDMMEGQSHQINIFIIILLVEEQVQEHSIITSILMIRRLNFK